MLKTELSVFANELFIYIYIINFFGISVKNFTFLKYHLITGCDILPHRHVKLSSIFLDNNDLNVQ